MAPCQHNKGDRKLFKCFMINGRLCKNSPIPCFECLTKLIRPHQCHDDCLDRFTNSFSATEFLLKYCNAKWGSNDHFCRKDCFQKRVWHQKFSMKPNVCGDRFHQSAPETCQRDPMGEMKVRNDCMALKSPTVFFVLK